MGRMLISVMLFNNILLYAALIAIIIAEVFALRSWVNQIADGLVESDVDMMELRALSVAQRSSTLFRDMSARLLLTRNFTESLLSGDLSANMTNLPPAYGYNDTLLSSAVAVHTVFYSQPTLMDTYPLTRVLRNPWRLSKDEFIGQGFGATDGFYRKYPFARNPQLATLRYTCTSNDPLLNNTQVVGFLPQCRPWFAPAQADTTKVHDSVPYLDAESNQIVISLSTAVLWPNASLYGVIYADVPFTPFITAMNSEEGSAWVFLMDQNSVVIVGRGITTGNRLANALYGSDDNARQLFETNVLPLLLGSTGGRVTFHHEGSDVVGGFARVAGTQYIAVMVQRHATITQPTIEVRGSAEGKIFIIAYLISYFALYSIGYGAIVQGSAASGGASSFLAGLCKFGLPVVIQFLCLLALALPLSLVANYGVVSDGEDLVATKTGSNVQFLSANAVSWLERYLLSANDRCIAVVNSAASDIDFLQSDLLPRPYYLDTASTATLATPLTVDARLGNGTISLAHSSVYIPGVNEPADLASAGAAARSDAVQSNYFDMYFASVYQTNPDFVLIYVGYASSTLRKYPGSVTQNRQYDPRTRPWYIPAIGSNTPQYTAPYRDAFSGEWMITVSSRLPTGAGAVGVVGGDLLLATISRIITDIRFFRTGKVTLLDVEDGVVVADREVLDTNGSTLLPYQSLQSPPITTSLFSRLSARTLISSELYQTPVGSFYISSRPLSQSNLQRYVILVSVPEAEAKEDLEIVLDKIRKANVGITVGLVVGCAVIVFWLFLIGGIMGAM